jgi:hypothetical protein
VLNARLRVLRYNELAHIFGNNAVPAKVINSNAVTTVEERRRWCCYGMGRRLVEGADEADLN